MARPVASSRDALKVAGPGPCSICGQFRLLFGKYKRLCRACAHDHDYWTESSAVDDAIDSVIEEIAHGRMADPEAAVAFAELREEIRRQREAIKATLKGVS